MITVSKQENGVLFTFQNSDKYLYGSGTIEVPFNSLSIIQDESDNITLRKSASNDIFLSARYDTDFGYASKEEAVNALKEILYDEAGISEEEVQEMIDAATSGIPSSEVVEQLRRDVNAVSGEVDTKQDILTAGENITISGNVISADAGNNIIELTQAEYDALETKDPEALYIITDAQEINMNDYYTKSEVDASIATKADASALTAVNNALTAHTADTNVHVTQAEKNAWNGKVDTTTYESGQYATAQALNALQENKLDASAYTPTDLSEYWTSAQTQSAIDAATSGIPSSQVIEALRNDVNTVSGDVESKQDKLEYYSEAEYPTGGGRGMINVSNGKTYITQIDASASYTDGGTYAIFYAKGEAGSNTLKVSPDGVTINDAKVLTENDINVNELWETLDEKEEVIASALTQLNQDVAEIDAKEEVIASALTEVNLTLDNKLDASAYTPTDLSEYWTSAQTQSAIDDAVSGKADTSAITSIESAVTNVQSVVTEVSNNVDALSGAVIDNEYTVSQAINSLNNRVTAVESGGSSVTVDTTLDSGSTNPVANSAITAAINDAKAYYVDFAAMSVQGITDADWDGLVAAINAHRPILVKVGTANGYVNATTAGIFDNTIIVTGADEGNASKYTFTKNGSNDYSVSTSTKKFVTQAEKDAWNAKVSSTSITQIVKLTQAAYDALATKDAQTLYIVVD